MANPCITILTLDDVDCWDEWYNKLKKGIELMVTEDLSEVTMYVHEKEEDLQDFYFRGIKYTDSSYCDMYRIDGISVTSIPISGIKIRAKSIRKDPAANAEFLHPEVYEYITNTLHYKL